MPLQVATGVWHHVVLVYNGQNVYLYIENVLVELDPATGTTNFTWNKATYLTNASNNQFICYVLDSFKISCSLIRSS